ncbi:MAG: hypothetical protein OXH16_03035 [Gemmatimonadetes bacterium]|nr:hypothetical protein [Gemmatimonadota bacterium]
MEKSNILKQRARTPKPNDEAAWARSKAELNQMVETERRKDRADRQRGRAADRLDCVQIEFGFLRSLRVRDGSELHRSAYRLCGQGEMKK